MTDSSHDSAPATSRAANIMHLTPPDAARLVQLIMPSLAAQVDAPEAGLRTLVLTDDEETAVALAREASREIGGGAAPIVAFTAATRAQRVFRGAIPGAVAMPLGVAHALVATSALPLATVRNAIFALPSAPLTPAMREAIDALLAELPKGASRILVAASETPDIEALAERHFFKARRVREAQSAALRGFNGRIEVLVASTGTRWDAIRRFLDQNDPPSCAIVASNAAQLGEADSQLASMGYGSGGPVVTTRETPEYGTSVVVLLGVPDAARLEQAVAAGPGRVLIVCAGNEVRELRTLTAVPVYPVTLDGPQARANAREAAIRRRLREVLASGAYGAELNIILPLLDEYDGSEVAAAAVAMLGENQRSGAVPAIAAAPPRPAPEERRPSRGDARPPRESSTRPPRDGARSREFSRPPRDGERSRDFSRPPRDSSRGPRDASRPPRGDGGPPRQDRRGGGGGGGAPRRFERDDRGSRRDMHDRPRRFDGGDRRPGSGPRRGQ